MARFARQSCEIELVASGKLAISGDWQFSLSRQGQPLEPVSDWESICWHSDADVDYLELQIELAENVILQRHLVLAREDRLLLLADAVLGSDIGGLEYCGILPLAEGVEFRPAAETREGLLVRGARSRRVRGARNDSDGALREAVQRQIERKNQIDDPCATHHSSTASLHAPYTLAQILPLALPEWRSDARIGQLIGTARGLELHQETEGRRLFAPLLIDLDRARFRRRLTWRPLTVAASLVPVPAEHAVGYRAAVGKEQWLIY